MRLQRFRRTLIFLSFLFFSFTFVYLSPYLTVMGTIDRVVTAGMLFWSIFLLSSPWLGRALCGYICPLGGLQDSLHTAVDRPYRKVKYLKVVKYLLWAGWIGATIMIAVLHGGWQRFDLLFHIGDGFPPYARLAYIILYGFMILTTVTALLLGRRGFCHELCFFSPLNIIGTQVGKLLHMPALRVRVTNTASCKGCKACNRACPMSLDVEKMIQAGEVDDPECITCGSCTAACKFGTLTYGFSAPQQGRACQVETTMNG